MDLLDKIRKGRESIIDVGNIKLTITRPTDLDALDMTYSSNRAAIEGISRFVVGWTGVKELDLIPGGTADMVPFNSDVFAEWIKDKPEYWEAMISGVRNAYQAYRGKQDTETKN